MNTRPPSSRPSQIRCDLWIFTCILIVHYFNSRYAPKLFVYLYTYQSFFLFVFFIIADWGIDLYKIVHYFNSSHTLKLFMLLYTSLQSSPSSFSSLGLTGVLTRIQIINYFNSGHAPKLFLQLYLPWIPLLRFFIKTDLGTYLPTNRSLFQ